MQIVLEKVSKIFSLRTEQVNALNDINLVIPAGEFLAIVGPSGSGKSTLLHLLGGLDTATSGTITVRDQIISNLNDKHLSHFINKKIGFVFQDFNLHPHLTLLENVALPAIIGSNGKSIKQAFQKAEKLLKETGLESRAAFLPEQVSGGQAQRAAIARALINNPDIILADEPTGNLDSRTATEILTLLKQIHKSQNKTLIIVTHDQAIAAAADRTIEISAGKLITQNSFSRFTSISTPV